jgi:hypothetical protein
MGILIENKIGIYMWTNILMNKANNSMIYKALLKCGYYNF